MKKRNLNSFKLRKELVSTLNQDVVIGGADQEAAKTSRRWWKCSYMGTVGCSF